MRYQPRYVVSCNSQLISPKQGDLMRFSQLRRRRRQPKPPFFLLELNLSLDEIVADLVYPAPSAV
jgi:hypothetical protein